MNVFSKMRGSESVAVPDPVADPSGCSVDPVGSVSEGKNKGLPLAQLGFDIESTTK